MALFLPKIKKYLVKRIMERMDLRQWLFGLLIECPMRNELENCPMKMYRRQPSTKKINIAFEVPEKELTDLLQHHKKCLAERELVIIKKQLDKVGSRKYNTISLYK